MKPRALRGAAVRRMAATAMAADLPRSKRSVICLNLILWRGEEQRVMK